MKLLTTCIVIALVIGFVTVTYGQDYSHYYRPYGLTMPPLEKGEYALSISTDYINTNSEYDWFDSGYTSGSKSNGDYYEARINATFALSKHLFVNSFITYRPSQSINKYEYYNQNNFGSTQREEEIKAKNSFDPGINFVFKPSPFSEIVARYYYYGDSDDVWSTIDPTSYKIATRVNDRHYISLTYNLIGKL